MSQLNFERIWKLMNDNDLEVVKELPMELTCGLCFKLIIDARICPCGCRFCDKCITDYLADYLAEDIEFCPGKTNECDEESLSLDTNVWIDHVTNRKIANTKVKCSTAMCTFQDCIKDIEQHISGCQKLSIKCPYINYGCDQTILDESDLSNHFKSDKDKHLALLTSKIDEITAENQSLKDEIKSLQNERNDQKMNMDKMKRKLAGLRHDISDKLDKIIKIQAAGQVKLESALDKEIKEIDHMKLRLNDYCNANIKEFKWELCNISKLRETKIRVKSDEFYTHLNGYKLQIELIYDRYGNIDIYVKIVNGTYNSQKLWPISLDINLGIVNEITQDFSISDKKTLTYEDQHSNNDVFLQYCPTQETLLANNDVFLQYCPTQETLLANKFTIKCFVKVII